MAHDAHSGRVGGGEAADTCGTEGLSPAVTWNVPVRHHAASSEVARIASGIMPLLGSLSRPTARQAVVAMLCAAGAVVCVATVDNVYAIEDWLFWRLLILWSWCAFLQAACFSTGHLVLTRVLKIKHLPLIEKLVVSVALGLVAFTMAMYLGGLLAFYQPFLAIALPATMLAAGAPALYVWSREVWKEGASTPREHLSAWPAAALIVGALCLVLLYLQCMTPASLNYDSRWYHLAVAQDYAREGRIVRFRADYNKAFPQLTSLVHTWGYLVPGLSQPERWMLALHNEYCLVLWTISGVGAVAAWLVERDRLAGSWAAFFLFPAIFVYDSNIGGSADHVLAFFTPPLFLAAARAVPSLSPGRCALVGAVAAGAVLTKYQSVYMIAPIGALIGGYWLWPDFFGRTNCLTRWRLWRGPATLIAVGMLLTLPHFLKNWVFYGNPVYPFMSGAFPGTNPRPPDMELLVTHLYAGDATIPRGSFGTVVKATLDNAITPFFRKPYSFGLIFPLLLPLVPLVGGGRRLWAAVFVSVGAHLTWAFTYPIERYLQAIVPMFAAVAAAIIVRVWQLGWITRTATLVLLGTHVVWGADALFYSGHRRMDDSIKLIRSGSQGRARSRFDDYLASQVALDDRLPHDAVLLFHNTRLSLGVNRTVLQDLPGFQGLISYKHVQTPRELCQLYRSLGVTHVLHERGLWPAYTKQEEVVFAAFLARHAENIFRQGEYEVMEVPAELPPVETPYRVLTVGLDGYADGVYAIEALDVYEPLAARFKRFPTPTVAIDAEEPNATRALQHVDAVLASNLKSLPENFRERVHKQFVNVVSYSNHAHFGVYIRRIAPPR